MQLILEQYLSSLKERGELDTILPMLLSEMGLNVLSKPTNPGVRQYGVDVEAVGNIGDEEEKLYLFTIKRGNITRSNWDDDTNQSLRKSLNEIIDVYITKHLPTEHKDKKIIICICFGGIVTEDARENVRTYKERNTTDTVSFEDWNGGYLADKIQKYLFNENLLKDESRANLRKTLAILDNPKYSSAYYRSLLNSIIQDSAENNPDRSLQIIRQISICQSIVFSWSRDINNLEAAYLCSELSILYAWEISGKI